MYMTIGAHTGTKLLSYTIHCWDTHTCECSVLKTTELRHSVLTGT